MDVLISGAGVAGPALAHFLGRGGHRVTVVERARDLRSSGSPVDVRGEAHAIAESIGVLPRLREAATDVDGLTFLGRDGRRIGRVDLSTKSGEIEVPRGDLATVLYETGRDDAEYVFADSIATLRQDPDGVDVTFEKGAPRRFDLVVGADGLHSTTRRLAFGPESDHVHGIGMYVATMPVDGDIGRDVIIHNTPGRMVSLHPSRGRALAAFIFRHPPVEGLDHRDTERQRRIITRAYTGDGWRVPELLEHMLTTPDLYFDAVSRVEIDTWTKGRVTLLGDAASSVSLFGDGSSSAIVGARTLAEELTGGGRELAAALLRYEARHRKVVAPRLRNVAVASHFLVPASRAGLALRNLATRLSPAIDAGRRLTTRRGPAVP